MSEESSTRFDPNAWPASPKTSLEATTSQLRAYYDSPNGLRHDQEQEAMDVQDQGTSNQRGSGRDSQDDP